MRAEYPGEQNQDFRYLRQRLGREKWARALDAGCGRGLYLRGLALATDFATGVDSSLENLRAFVATRRGSAVVNGRLEQLPYGSEEFDLVLCVEVLTHIQPAQQPAAVLELFRVLRPGGTLVISVHNVTRHSVHRLKRGILGAGKTPAGAAIFPLSRPRFRQMLEDAGFRIRDRVRHINFFNGFDFALIRRRPRFASSLARLEDVMTAIPGVRRLSITMLVEGIKPQTSVVA